MLNIERENYFSSKIFILIKTKFSKIIIVIDNSEDCINVRHLWLRCYFYVLVLFSMY